MTWLAGIVVVGSGLWLIGLAAAVWLAPPRAERLLGAFASSARAHYLEQTLRLIAGLAFVAFAPQMRFPEVFRLFGWLVLVTAAGLLLIPWRWHHRFGTWVIPLAIRHMRLFSLGAFALGSLILYGVFGVS